MKSTAARSNGRRQRVLVSLAGLATLGVIGVGLLAARGNIAETFWLWRLERGDLAAQIAAAEKLGARRSTRSAAALARFLERRPAPGKAAGRFVVETMEINRGSNMSAVLLKEEDIHPATAALIRIGAASLPFLLELLERQDARVALQVCHALGELGPAAGVAVPRLEAIKKRGDSFEHVASEALGKIRNRAATPPAPRP